MAKKEKKGWKREVQQIENLKDKRSFLGKIKKAFLKIF